MIDRYFQHETKSSRMASLINAYAKCYKTVIKSSKEEYYKAKREFDEASENLLEYVKDNFEAILKKEFKIIKDIKLAEMCLSPTLEIQLIEEKEGLKSKIRRKLEQLDSCFEKFNIEIFR